MIIPYLHVVLHFIYFSPKNMDCFCNYKSTPCLLWVISVSCSPGTQLCRPQPARLPRRILPALPTQPEELGFQQLCSPHSHPFPPRSRARSRSPQGQPTAPFSRGPGQAPQTHPGPEMRPRVSDFRYTGVSLVSRPHGARMLVFADRMRDARCGVRKPCCCREVDTWSGRPSAGRPLWAPLRPPRGEMQQMEGSSAEALSVLSPFCP